MPTYDPDRACFQAFVKYWAGILLLRYWHARDDRRRVEALCNDLSRLIESFPGLEPDRELNTLVQRIVSREIAAEVYAELMRLTFGGSSPPHQLIAFGFCRLLSGWPPQRVAAELSEIPLRRLAQMLGEAYAAESGLPATLVRSYLKPLAAGMDLKFSEAVKDPHTRETYPELSDRIVGDTTLRDYYRGKPEDSIVHWHGSVRRAVRSAIVKHGDAALVGRLESLGVLEDELRKWVAKQSRRGRGRAGGRGDV
jgi:hypothetical protein